MTLSNGTTTGGHGSDGHGGDGSTPMDPVVDVVWNVGRLLLARLGS